LGQILLTWVTAGIAIVSFVAVGFSAYYASQGVTAKQFDTTNAILHREMVLLDSIRVQKLSSVRGIQKATKDSIDKQGTSHFGGRPLKLK
jgi:hypothetical protein